MTREEAEGELYDERIKSSEKYVALGPADYWFDIAVTERLARREAEARVKELESAIYAHGEQVLTGGEYVNPKTTLGNMVSMIVALRERVEDLEEQLAYRDNKWMEKQP